MKLLFHFISFIVLFSPTLGFTFENKGSGANTQVAILQIIQHPALDASRQGIEDVLKEAGFCVQFESAQGNPSLAAQIAQKFVGSKTNILVGIGTTATQALVSANRNHRIPIVFCSVTDPKEAKLIHCLEKPENNITGVSNFIEPKTQFEFIRNMASHFSKLGIIYNPGEPNSVSLIEKMKQAAKLYHFELIFAVANNSAEVASATQSLMGKVDALFINNDNTALSAFESIVKISEKNKIPVFSSDIDTVHQGATAAFGPSQYEIGRQSGQIILAILKGKKMSALPVKFPEKIQLKLNLKMANKIGFKIPNPIVNLSKQ